MNRIERYIRRSSATLLLGASLLTAMVSTTEASNSDKVAHAAAGAAIYGACMVTGKVAHIDWLNYKICLIPVGVAAVGKEIYDAQGNGDASVGDAAATMAIPALFAGVKYTLYEW